MARNKNVEQEIEQALYAAGISESGMIAQIAWGAIEQISKPMYRYEDEDGSVWFGTDPEGMCDSFGCELSDLEGGYFLPAKL